MVIRLTPDIEDVLNEKAQQQGVSPEQLALDSLGKLFLDKKTPDAGDDEKNLLDCLAGHVGVVDGSTEAYSENCGRRFSDGLAAKHELFSP